MIPQCSRFWETHRALLPYERIDDGECREAAEVAIGSPQLANAMIAADGSDASIMDLRTTDAALLKRGA